VGREPTGGELYAAHFLGPQGSARLIETARSTPHASAASLFPDAAASNHAVFYRGGRAVSVSELYTDLTSTAGQAGASAPAAAAAPVQDTGFLQYASARRIDRLEQEQALVDIVLRGPQDPAEGGSGHHSIAVSLFSADMLRVLSEARREGGG